MTDIHDKVAEIFAADMLGFMTTEEFTQHAAKLVKHRLSPEQAEFLQNLNDEDLETAVCGEQSEMVAVCAPCAGLHEALGDVFESLL